MVKKDEISPQEGKAKEVKVEEKAGFSLSNFFQGTREELDKVVWPSRQQLVSESVAVILMVILSATTIFFVDKLFSWAAKQVF